jgi:hypothetical protein
MHLCELVSGETHSPVQSVTPPSRNINHAETFGSGDAARRNH